MNNPVLVWHLFGLAWVLVSILIYSNLKMVVMSKYLSKDKWTGEDMFMATICSLFTPLGLLVLLGLFLTQDSED